MGDEDDVSLSLGRTKPRTQRNGKSRVGRPKARRIAEHGLYDCTTAAKPRRWAILVVGAEEERCCCRCCCGFWILGIIGRCWSRGVDVGYIGTRLLYYRASTRVLVSASLETNISQ